MFVFGIISSRPGFYTFLFTLSKCSDRFDLLDARARAHLEAGVHNVSVHEVEVLPSTSKSLAAKHLAKDKNDRAVIIHITSLDWVTVQYFPDHVEGTRFVFRHNGVKIEEDRFNELVG